MNNDKITCISVNSDWRASEVITIEKNCGYEIRCEKNINIPAFENKEVEKLLEIFTAQEILDCKSDLTEEEKTKLNLIRELSK
jgi:hypothetical protein